MYQRQSIKINTLLVLSCILYLGFEFGIYYLTDSALYVFGIAVLGGLILTHTFLEAALTYDVCFLLVLFSAVPASILSLLIYFNQTGNLLIYHDFLPYLVLAHWLVPVFYCTFRCLTDRGPRFVRYNSFFVKASILFFLYYLPALVIRSFIIPLEFPYTFSGREVSLMPFMETATHIEDFIYTGVGINALLSYIVHILFLFLPVGFYGALLLKQLSMLPKALLCLVIPACIEGVIWLTKGTFVIDACIFRFFGILLGIIAYKTINQLFRFYTREDFLYERNRYSFFN